MLSSTCNTGPSSTLKFVYKVYGKIPLFILIGRIGLSLAKCRWWDAHKVLMECQSSLIIIIIIFQISCISPLIRSNHELKSSLLLFVCSYFFLNFLLSKSWFENLQVKCVLNNSTVEGAYDTVWLMHQKLWSVNFCLPTRNAMMRTGDAMASSNRILRRTTDAETPGRMRSNFRYQKWLGMPNAAPIVNMFTANNNKQFIFKYIHIFIS